MKSCWMILLIKNNFLFQIKVLKKPTCICSWTSGEATIQKLLKSLASLLRKVMQKLGLHKGSSFL